MGYEARMDTRHAVIGVRGKTNGMTGTELADAWRKYKQGGDAKARAAIINQFSYLVKITAGRVVSNIPPSLEREDLVSAGVVGLIKAVDQFDFSRQVKFETYAIALIRGAILEMLREEDWVPRSVRERIKTLERAYLGLETSLGRPPSEHEVARDLNMSVEEFNKLLLDTGRTSLLSLDDILVGTEGSEKLHLSDVVHDGEAGPTGELELKEMKRTLGESIDRLPDRERLVIALYYYEGLTFKEIGKILTISESRVYQLHTQAVIRLRGYIQRDAALFH
jgi:RNA polymerase sigma factor for flagellar operon FliA